MEKEFKSFYRNFYNRTGGFIPASPINLNVFPGDFFQIKNGEIIIYGNVFRDKVIDPQYAEFEYGIKLNPSLWNFNEGVRRPYSGRGTGHTSGHDGLFEFSRQVLAFSDKGNYMFRGNNPESVKIRNFNDFQQQLIIRLTTVMFSFRELYVVTESATTSDWTLAVSGSEKGELEIATDSESYAFHDIFGQQNTKTIQSKDILYYHRETGRRPNFFKAKKLVVNPERLQVFISQLIEKNNSQNEWLATFFDDHFESYHEYTPSIRQHNQAGLLDLLQANELNPNTALLYFNWVDASTDDIDLLFLNNAG